MEGDKITMLHKISEPTLETFVTRYNKDMELLESHPEQKELLERRIERHKQDIIDYVISKRFEQKLKYFHL